MNWDKITTMLWHDKREREFVVCNRFMWAITFGWWPRYLSKKSRRKWMREVFEAMKEGHPEWQKHLAEDVSPVMVVKYISEGMLGPIHSAEVIVDNSGDLNFKKREKQ